MITPLRKMLLGLSVVVVLGAGCQASTQIAVPPTPVPTPAELTSTGCMPKALTVLEPLPGSTVTSPVTVRVKIDNRQDGCHWTAFEAQAGGLTIKNDGGVVLGTGILKTTADWMTNDPVEYQGTVSLTGSVAEHLQLTIEEENPSGKPDPQTVTVGLHR